VPKLALLGELYADTGMFPAGLTLADMSDLQLQWLLFWKRKRDQARNRMLGEMLGVYWTAERYQRPGSGSGGQRSREVFLPLAAILNPEVLYKTLDKTLDTTPAAGQFDTQSRKVDLAAMPLQAYKDLFDISKQPNTEPKPAEQQAPEAERKQELFGVPASTPKEQLQMDLERLRVTDPELAAHLDDNASWSST